jgi:hypothetical protein
MENDCLRDVKEWMTFLGWTHDGGPGAVKHDWEGKKVAGHGDATWIADVDDVLGKIEREKARAEIARRELLGVTVT